MVLGMLRKIKVTIFYICHRRICDHTYMKNSRLRKVFELYYRCFNVPMRHDCSEKNRIEKRMSFTDFFKKAQKVFN